MIQSSTGNPFGLTVPLSIFSEKDKKKGKREKEEEILQNRQRREHISSMQNNEAALIKVAGTTIQWQSSQSMIGKVRCQRTRNLEVKRV